MITRSRLVFASLLMLPFGLLGIENVVTFEYDHPEEVQVIGEVVAETTETAEHVGASTRIMIPSIAVDAAIEEVALTEGGAMDVPARPEDTAWYSLGTRPGETGSAVIAGHVDWKDGAPAVFTDLHKLKPGDRIIVREASGEDIVFVVRESRMYDADVHAREVFLSDDGKAHMNLVTCAGAWDTGSGQYSKRLVVFTDKVTD